MHDELTKVDIQKMQEEIDYRLNTLRPKLIEDVQTARSFGGEGLQVLVPVLMLIIGFVFFRWSFRRISTLRRRMWRASSTS